MAKRRNKRERSRGPMKGTGTHESGTMVSKVGTSQERRFRFAGSRRCCYLPSVALGRKTAAARTGDVLTAMARLGWAARSGGARHQGGAQASAASAACVCGVDGEQPAAAVRFSTPRFDHYAARSKEPRCSQSSSDGWLVKEDGMSRAGSCRAGIS